MECSKLPSIKFLVLAVCSTLRKSKYLIDVSTRTFFLNILKRLTFSLLPKFHFIRGDVGPENKKDFLEERMNLELAEIDTQKFLVPSYIQMFSLRRHLKPKGKKKYCSISKSKCSSLTSSLSTSPLKGTTVYKGFAKHKAVKQACPLSPSPPLRLLMAGRDLKDTSNSMMFCFVFFLTVFNHIQFSVDRTLFNSKRM